MELTYRKRRHIVKALELCDRTMVSGEDVLEDHLANVKFVYFLVEGDVFSYWGLEFCAF